MSKNVLIFAGTTEGRQLANVLADQVGKLYISVATEYGRDSFADSVPGEVIWGRMNEEEIGDFVTANSISLVIDATHPFARIVTENIKSACSNKQVTYLRCLRDASPEVLDTDSDMLIVDSIEEAVAYLRHTEGNIFIATGSKELHLYTMLDDFQERCFARVLSVSESVSGAMESGFNGRHLIAMQGPFSEELNIAMLRHVQAKFFVTKESGKSGGFDEKVRAAEQTGCTLVVIGRPEEKGMSINEICGYVNQL